MTSTAMTPVDLTGFSAPGALLPNTSIRRLLVGGFLGIAVGMGGMGLWAGLAPLHSAIVASGALAPETGRKLVKHQEGGQVAEVLVRDGAEVKAGQVLLRFDATEAATRLEMLTAQWLDSIALDARLTAELLEKPAIAWPEELTNRRNPAVAKLMENQQTLFTVRKAQLKSEADLTADRVATLTEEVRSLEQQRGFVSREIALVQEDLRITKDLLSRGNSTRTKQVGQERDEARLRARDQELDVEIAKARNGMADVKGDLIRRQNDFREKVLTDLEKARAESARLSEQMRDAANRLAARDVKAPDDGKIVMHMHPAVGTTISANEQIMDIVPVEQQLLAEVKVQPKDIKSLGPDLPVKVQLTAYDSRVVGSLDGTVEYVSADRLTDPNTRTDYYLARIRLKDSDSHTVHSLKIKPGMPVEARIMLGGRTPLDYLITPLKQSYLKAFIQE